MMFKSSFGSLEYELRGPTDAPILVFTHGLGMDRASFRPQADYFSKHYQVLLWDLPYRNGAFEERRFSFEMLSEGLIELLDHLSARQVFHIGHAHGGFFGQYFAIRHPERVRGLVEIGSLPLVRLTPLRAWFLKLRTYALGLLPEKVYFRRHAREKALNSAARIYLYKQGLTLGKGRLLELEREALDAILKRPEGQVSVPTLVLCGSQDRASIKRHAEIWDAVQPFAEQQVVEGGSHLCMLDNPGDCNEKIETFLKDHIQAA